MKRKHLFTHTRKRNSNIEADIVFCTSDIDGPDKLVFPDEPTDTDDLIQEVIRNISLSGFHHHGGTVSPTKHSFIISDSPRDEKAKTKEQSGTDEDDNTDKTTSTTYLPTTTITTTLTTLKSPVLEHTGTFRNVTTEFTGTKKETTSSSGRVSKLHFLFIF